MATPTKFYKYTTAKTLSDVAYRHVGERRPWLDVVMPRGARSTAIPLTMTATAALVIARRWTQDSRSELRCCCRR
jgi:hypothetical protein